MTLSKTCQYALRALIYIMDATPEGVNRIGISEIAENIDSPQAFTAKILQVMTKKKIIGSVKGPGGGFYTNKLTGKATIFQVIALFEGEDYCCECLLGLPKCSDKNPCPVHFKYKKIRTETNELFKSITIEELANQLAQGKDQFRIS